MHDLQTATERRFSHEQADSTTNHNTEEVQSARPLVQRAMHGLTEHLITKLTSRAAV